MIRQGQKLMLHHLLQLGAFFAILLVNFCNARYTEDMTMPGTAYQRQINEDYYLNPKFQLPSVMNILEFIATKIAW
jgi:hypothetical protein